MKFIGAFIHVPCVFAAISGRLEVSFSDDQVKFNGKIQGLRANIKDGKISVNTGTDCSSGKGKTVDEVDAFVGDHLMSGNIDNWIPCKYDTNAHGKASVRVFATGHTLEEVVGHCIVMHGVSAKDLSPRVAIGKIVKSGGTLRAAMGRYPGPAALSTTPSGELTVAMEGVMMSISGEVKNLAKGITKAGIHVHTGTDCTGGKNTSTVDAVNAVVGGHLFGIGDAWLQTKYSSNAKGISAISIATPKNSHTLLRRDHTAKMPAVQNHCVVVSEADDIRVAIGKIVCTGSSCHASMEKYPSPSQPSRADRKFRSPHSRAIRPSK